MDSLVEMDVMDCLEHKDLWDLRENLVLLVDPPDNKDSLELGGIWTTGSRGTSWTKEWRGHLHQVGKELLP